MKNKDLKKILVQAKRLIDSGDHLSAKPLCQKALRRASKNHYATFLMGRISFLQDDYQKAIHYFDSALARSPDNPEYLYFRGTVFSLCRQFEKAFADFQKALRISPGNRSLLIATGDAFVQTGKLEQAGDSYEKALQVAPDDLSVLMELAKKLELSRNFQATVECYQKALGIDGENITILNNFAVFLHRHNHSSMALPYLGKALELDPKHLAAHTNLGSVLSSLRRIGESCSCIRQALKIDPSSQLTHSNLLLTMHYDTLCSAEEVYLEHLKWNNNHGEGKIRHHHSLSRHAPGPGRKIRIGYVSSDFRIHSVAYFILPVLQAHNIDAFEIFCYANVAKPDACTQAIKSLKGLVWRDIVDQSDDQAAQIIYDDNIDILVDLAGHTGAGRLTIFAFKPAPIQVTYLGYPDTTGMSAMDYRLTDAWADPVGRTDHLHAEKLCRLPGGFLCYQPPPECPELQQEPPVRRNGYITFGSFNNFSKISDAVIQVWARLLLQVPNSRLLIKSKSLLGSVAQDFLDTFESRGIASDRITTKAWTSSSREHLELYHSIDIALDTFPYNGTTTTLEALWMGTPVVTLTGETHVTRVGCSILSKLELKELIAHSPDEYIKKCASLAGETTRLTQLSIGMRQRMMDCGMLDATGFTSELEHTFRKMIDSWRITQTLAPRLPLHRSVKIFGNLDITVPHSLEDYDTYNLLEHEDVSPPALAFSRKLVKRRGTVIDADAGVGEFVISTAFTAGTGTSVVAIEADPEKATFLQTNIARNLLDNCHPHHLQLISTENSSPAMPGKTGTTPRMTLDAFINRHQITDLRFVKLGHRCRAGEILSGATLTLTEQSPIIALFSMQHQETSAVVTMLANLGYSLFRYSPGLQLLLPTEANKAQSSQDVLFACKHDAIKHLEEQNLLATVTLPFTPSPIHRETFIRELEALFPFALMYREQWTTMDPLEDWEVYLAGLHAYNTSRSGLETDIRASALCKAYALVSHCCDSAPTFTRFLTLSRLAVDSGYCDQALQILFGLQDLLTSAPEQIKLSTEPFLPPCPRFDTIMPNHAEGDWLLAAILEQIELLKYPSSHSGDQTDALRLEILDSTGFTNVPMLRRRQLLRTKLGLQKQLVPSIDLHYPAKMHLNHRLWT